MTITPLPRSTVDATTQQPDALGRFGKFGGKYVPETLMPALAELEQCFRQYCNDPDYQKELQGLQRDYVGRPSPLYFAERLTAHYAKPDGTGVQIYLKREDLNHTGAHKINNALAQVLLAKRMGKTAYYCRNGCRTTWRSNRNCLCQVWAGMHRLYGRPGYGTSGAKCVSDAADGGNGAACNCWHWYSQRGDFGSDSRLGD